MERIGTIESNWPRMLPRLLVRVKVHASLGGANQSVRMKAAAYFLQLVSSGPAGFLRRSTETEECGLWLHCQELRLRFALEFVDQDRDFLRNRQYFEVRAFWGIPLIGGRQSDWPCSTLSGTPGWKQAIVRSSGLPIGMGLIACCSIALNIRAWAS